MSEFTRELRYLVAKVKDVNAALSEEEKQQLHQLLSKVDAHRVKAGKATLECVVVESDWPNYQATWDSVKQVFDQARLSGK